MHSLLAYIFLLISLVCSAQQFDTKATEIQIAAAATMSGQEVFDQGPDATLAESAEDHEAGQVAHDSDDEPMIHTTPKDYATWARNERDRLLAEGADPDSVILQSQVGNYVPKIANELPADFTKRYVNTINGMVRSGVKILNDICTADVAPSHFRTAEGRSFDLGPESGVTKGEYRDFNSWFSKMSKARRTGKEVEQVPEKWLKYEIPAEEKSDL